MKTKALNVIRFTTKTDARAGYGRIQRVYIMADFDWNQFPNFSASEFRCQHTGTDGMDEDFVRCLQQLRTIYGKGMVISSGYRSAEHPIEARKPNGPGAHESGKAADIAIYGADALELLTLALQSGLFTGIGVAQKGSLGSRFLHLDTLEGGNRPTIWSY